MTSLNDVIDVQRGLSTSECCERNGSRRITPCPHCVVYIHYTERRARPGQEFPAVEPAHDRNGVGGTTGGEEVVHFRGREAGNFSLERRDARLVARSFPPALYEEILGALLLGQGGNSMRRQNDKRVPATTRGQIGLIRDLRISGPRETGP